MLGIVLCLFVALSAVRECPQPKNPNNGKVLYRRPIYRPGNRVSYECNKGYSNTGASFQTCEENLKWSKEGPKCRRKIGK